MGWFFPVLEDSRAVWGCTSVFNFIIDDRLFKEKRGRSPKVDCKKTAVFCDVTPAAGIENSDAKMTARCRDRHIRRWFLTYRKTLIFDTK